MQSQSATFRKDPPAPHRPPAVHHSFSFPKKSTKSSSSGKPLAPSSAHSSAPLPQANIEVRRVSKEAQACQAAILRCVQEQVLPHLLGRLLAVLLEELLAVWSVKARSHIHRRMRRSLGRRSRGCRLGSRLCRWKATCLPVSPWILFASSARLFTAGRGSGRLVSLTKITEVVPGCQDSSHSLRIHLRRAAVGLLVRMVLAKPLEVLLLHVCERHRESIHVLKTQL